MNNAVGLGVFALGIVLLITGLSQTRVLPTDFVLQAGSSSFWLTLAGLVTVAAGVWLSFKNSPSD